MIALVSELWCRRGWWDWEQHGRARVDGGAAQGAVPGVAGGERGVPVRGRGVGVQGGREDVRAEPPGRRAAAGEPEVRSGARGPAAFGVRGDHARVSPEQAALEHDHAGRLGARRDGGRLARRLLRPGGRVAAEGTQAVTAIPVRWLTVFLDFPADSFGARVAFWREVTGSTLSPFRGAAGEFATLLPADGDAYLRVQRVAGRSGGHHLDLHVDPALASVEQAAERAVALGAKVLHRELGLVISASP